MIFPHQRCLLHDTICAKSWGESLAMVLAKFFYGFVHSQIIFRPDLYKLVICYIAILHTTCCDVGLHGQHFYCIWAGPFNNFWNREICQMVDSQSVCLCNSSAPCKISPVSKHCVSHDVMLCNYFVFPCSHLLGSGI